MDTKLLMLSPKVRDCTARSRRHLGTAFPNPLALHDSETTALNH